MACGYVIYRLGAFSARIGCINAPLHICVRPLQVARSTEKGNARASESGTSNKVQTLTLFFVTKGQRGEDRG